MSQCHGCLGSTAMCQILHLIKQPKIEPKSQKKGRNRIQVQRKCMPFCPHRSGYKDEWAGRQCLGLDVQMLLGFIVVGEVLGLGLLGSRMGVAVHLGLDGVVLW